MWFAAVVLLVAVATAPAAAIECIGDCDLDGTVDVTEVLRGVRAALGDAAPPCAAWRAPLDVAQLTRAVAHAVGGCGPQTGRLGGVRPLAYRGMVRNAPKAFDAVRGIAVSPDGVHLYAATSTGLAVFALDAVHGAPRFLAVAPPGPESPQVVVVSADGRHVYAGGGEAVGRLDVYGRDAGTGLLAPLSRLDLPRLERVRALAASADGRRLLVGGVGRAVGQLVELERDSGTGNLVPRQVLTTSELRLHTVTAVAVTADAAQVNVAGEENESNIASVLDLRRDDTGLLRVRHRLGPSEHGLRIVSDLALAEGGTALFVAGALRVPQFEFAPALGRLGRTADGIWTRRALVAFPDTGIAARLALNVDTTRALLLVDGGRLAVIGIGPEVLTRLSLSGVADGLRGLTSADALALNPSRPQAYAGSGIGNVVALATDVEPPYVVAVVSGALDGVDGLLGTRLLALSPEGTSLYASGEQGTIAELQRDPGSGALRWRDVWRGADEATPEWFFALNSGGLAVSADGANLYASSPTGDAVLSFERDRRSGALGFVKALADIRGDGDGMRDGPTGVVVSPDGADVYVGGNTPGGAGGVIAGFRRSGVADLTRTGASAEGGGAVVMSPDGAHLYASRSALVTLTRNSVDGRTAVLETQPLPDIVDRLAISPDGRHLYLGADSQPSIAVYARGPDGRLVLLGDDAIPAAGVTDLTVSPDGTALYASSAGELLLVCERDPASGRVRWVQTHRDGSGADGLAGASRILASADGRSVYVAGALDDGIAIFTVTDPE